MRWLTRILLVLGLLWAGAWFLLAHQLKVEVVARLAEQEAAGLVAETGGLSVQGWPYRFDLTLDHPHFAGTGWDWQAPFVQVLAMAWKPWHVIAAIPGGSRVTLPGQVLTLDTSRIEGSLRMAPEAGLPPREARVEWQDLAVTSSKGWTISTAHSLAAAQETADQALKVWLQIDDLHLPQDSDLGGLGPVIASVRFDARLPLVAPLTWERMPQFDSAEIRTLDLSWGSLDLEGTGRVTADPTGRAEGEITFHVTGWQALPDAAVQAGLIPPGMRGAFAGALQGMAEAGGDPAVLTLPLTLKDGRMTLGPLPLGEAPYLQ